MFVCFCTAGVWPCSHETVPLSVLEAVAGDARRLYPTVWWLCLGWEIVPVFTFWVLALKWLLHLFSSLSLLVNQTQLSRFWDMLLFLQDWSNYQRGTEGFFNTFQAIPAGKTAFFSSQTVFFLCSVLYMPHSNNEAACLIVQPCNYDVTCLLVSEFSYDSCSAKHLTSFLPHVHFS